ncbi:MAG: ABC transporter permease subunit [Eubacteriales bacterium]|nr:ABC transporter permease subunit [Eubacteriales bacterium]
MNMLAQELRRSFRSWLYFTLGMTATIALFCSFFNFLKADVQLINRILQNFPPEFRAAFGFADVDLSQAEGYISFINGYIVLIGAVYGMKLGVQLLSEEGRRRAVDFLLTKPVRRATVFGSKFATILINLIAQNIIIYLAGILMVTLIIGDSVDPGIYALLSFSSFFVQLFFVGIGLVIAVLAQRIKSVTPIALGVVFFFFIIQLVNESVRDEILSYVTPFAYFQGSDILRTRGYDAGFLLIDLAIFSAFSMFACLIYQKKDFHTA